MSKSSEGCFVMQFVRIYVTICSRNANGYFRSNLQYSYNWDWSIRYVLVSDLSSSQTAQLCAIFCSAFALPLLRG